MHAIFRALRTIVVERANGLCEYCQTTQTIVIEMEIDHVVPKSEGGATSQENLCLACVSCNGYKGTAQASTDPETAQLVPLFNPRTQSWSDHFRWDGSGTHLLGITPVGRATVERLKINREVAVRARERWVAAGWHPPKKLS